MLSSSFVSVGFSLVLWTNAYGGAGDQSASSIVETADGGFAIFGDTNNDTHLSDLLLIKIDADGNMQWNQTYGMEWSHKARSVVQTSDEGYILFGQISSSFQSGSSDFWLIKTNKNGDLQWYQTYGQWYLDDPSSIVETSDGGFALAGTTLSIVGKLEDYFLVKTDSYGNLMWNKTYGGGRHREYSPSVVETVEGGYALAGHSLSMITGDYSSWLVKTDANGNMEWNQTYSGGGSILTSSLVQTSDGGFALGGTTPNKFLLFKTDEFGNMQWNQTYREGGGPLILTSDGGFAFAGSYRNEDTYSDAWLIKTDANGDVEWNQNHSMTDRQSVSSLIQLSNGGFALAGRTFDLNDENSDFWVLITDEQGIPEFPSWTILPLFLVATFSAIIVKKRLFSQSS